MSDKEKKKKKKKDKIKVPYLERSAEELFYLPSDDKDFYMWGSQESPMNIVRPANWGALNLAENVEFPGMFESTLRALDSSHVCPRSFDLDVVPAIVPNLKVKRGLASVNSQPILFGLNGRIARYLSTQARGEGLAREEFEGEVEEHFVKTRKFGEEHICAEMPEDLYAGLDFAIPCRNFRNYFHFITESLCHLSLIKDIPNFDGKIYFFPLQKGEIPSFAVNAVNDLYPELADRVVFTDFKHVFDRVIMPFPLRHEYHYGDKTNFFDISRFLPSTKKWKNPRANKDLIATFEMNSFDRTLKKLRTDAFAKVEKSEIAKTGSKIVIRRDPTLGARSRDLGNGEKFYDELEKLGFEPVYFERMKPSEQVSVMKNADIVIGQHGAGFANMIYAKEGAKVIEIGNSLTFQNRMDSFLPIATISNCMYLVMVADLKYDDIAEAERARGSILPIQMSDKAIHRIINLVKLIMGQYDSDDINDLTDLVGDCITIGFWDEAKELLDRYEEQMVESAELVGRYFDILCHSGKFKEAKELLGALSLYGQTKEQEKARKSQIQDARKYAKGMRYDNTYL